MDAVTRRLVEQRAESRCEYCRLPQSAAPLFRFHVDHVTPRQHQADDSLDNLALACPHCNRRKGPNLTSIDPESGRLVPLFNPRTQNWSTHFERSGSELRGLTAVGRATARLLAMNDEEQQAIRVYAVRSTEP